LSPRAKGGAAAAIDARHPIGGSQSRSDASPPWIANVA
jgi:hypothetical protein